MKQVHIYPACAVHGSPSVSSHTCHTSYLVIQFVLWLQTMQDGYSAEHKSSRLLKRGSTQPGWQMFLLNFKVEWPLSLVVSKLQLLQYQLIFKHLFGLKFIERELANAWQQLQPCRGLSRSVAWGFRGSASKMPNYCL